MDITLKRILSLIPKKPNGDYVHGAKKEFCLSIEAPPNIISEWVRGISKSYCNYLYAISAKYNVSVEWLKGETDIKEKAPALSGEDSEFDSIFSQLNAQNKKIALAQLKALLDNQ